MHSQIKTFHILLKKQIIIRSYQLTQIYKKNTVQTKSVQHRFTKRLKGFGHISYAARLDRLKAETLELRRLKSYYLIRGFVDIDCNSLFHVIDCVSVHTRGHNLRLYKEHCNVNCRLNATLMSGTGYQFMS